MEAPFQELFSPWNGNKHSLKFQPVKLNSKKHVRLFHLRFGCISSWHHWLHHVSFQNVSKRINKSALTEPLESISAWYFQVRGQTVRSVWKYIQQPPQNQKLMKMHFFSRTEIFDLPASVQFLEFQPWPLHRAKSCLFKMKVIQCLLIFIWQQLVDVQSARLTQTGFLYSENKKHPW